MFVSLLTAKGEKISINIDKVLFFAQSKRCTSIVLEDGTLIDVNETYEEVLRLFTS